MNASAMGGNGLRGHVLNWRSLGGLVCLTVLIGGLYRQIAPRTYQAGDFSHTYRAAQALHEGNDIYAPALAWVETYRRGQPLTDQYFYAPTYALLLTPLTFLPYQAAITVWGVCLLGFLCVAVYALFRASGQPASLALVLLVAAAASLMSAVRAEYFLGQANLFMLACVCTAIWARLAERPGLAGILLALALVTKPMLLLISVFLFWKREFRFAITTIAGFMVLLLTPFLWLGLHVLVNLLTLWHFYSTQYLSFNENISPRGMLERLFTVNPFVPPLVDMPVLAVALWLVVVGVIFVVTLAVIAPRPFRRESRSLIELGVMISGLLLISPLTEPPYLVLLIMPLVGTLIYLRGVQWSHPPFRWAAAALGGLWVLELIPRHYTEDVISRLPHADPVHAALFVILVPTHFYILLGTFVLQLHVLHLASGSTTRDAVDRFVRNSPMLLGDWLRDLLAVRPVSRYER
jgi:hypothetical protein